MINIQSIQRLIIETYREICKKQHDDLQALRENPYKAPEPFEASIQLAYTKKVLNDLNNIIDIFMQPKDQQTSSQEEEQKKLIESLTEYLHENWQFIKETTILTSMANAPIINILCHIAEGIAEYYGKTTQSLTYLCPGTYPKSLDELIKPQELGMPITIPIDQSMSLIEFLEQHIYNPLEQVFIPIWIIFYEEIISPYTYKQYTWEQSEELLSQLRQHSIATKELIMAEDELATIRKDPNHLLGQLNLLALRLDLNSEDGIGTDEKAGFNAEIAIHKFHKFYQKLSIDQKNSLPLALQIEVKIIKNMIGVYEKPYLTYDSSDSKSLFVADDVDEPVIIPPILTCVGTRKNELKQIINNHGHCLTIYPKKNKEKKEAAQITSRISKNKKLICDQYRQGQYKGKDKLTVTSTVCKTLGIGYNIHNFASTVQLLTAIKASDLNSVLDSQDLVKHIVITIKRLEHLSYLCSHLPTEKINIFFKKIERYLEALNFKTIKRYLFFFATIPLEKVKAIFSAIPNTLSSVFIFDITYLPALKDHPNQLVNTVIQCLHQTMGAIDFETCIALMSYPYLIRQLEVYDHEKINGAEPILQGILYRLKTLKLNTVDFMTTLTMVLKLNRPYRDDNEKKAAVDLMIDILADKVITIPICAEEFMVYFVQSGSHLPHKASTLGMLLNATSQGVTAGAELFSRIMKQVSLSENTHRKMIKSLCWADYDLTKINLSTLNFTGVNLRGIKLSSANLLHLIHGRSKLLVFDGILLTNECFHRFDLTGISLIDVDISGSDFSLCNLSHSAFSGSIITNKQTSFAGATTYRTELDNMAFSYLSPYFISTKFNKMSLYQVDFNILHSLVKNIPFNCQFHFRAVFIDQHQVQLLTSMPKDTVGEISYQQRQFKTISGNRQRFIPQHEESYKVVDVQSNKLTRCKIIAL